MRSSSRSQPVFEVKQMMSLNVLNGVTWKSSFGIGLVLLLAVVGGCSSLPSDQEAGTSAASSSSGKSGLQLWTENCNRCHNIRPPDSYSDAQWDVAMTHMRIRANLTGEDARAILEYLKSAN
jgi:mono/diheme cytochrome c family protein